MVHLDRLDLRLAGMSPTDAATFARALRSELARLAPHLSAGAGAARVPGLPDLDIRLAPGESPQAAARRTAARLGAALTRATRTTPPPSREDQP